MQRCQFHEPDVQNTNSLFGVVDESCVYLLCWRLKKNDPVYAGLTYVMTQEKSRYMCNGFMLCIFKTNTNKTQQSLF